MVTKPRITVITLGHVDHGKSTLVGRFLFEMGAVRAEEIERYATLGAEMGKSSFKYAWVMDRSDESRRRGLTLDLNYADVETRRREIHIIDAPGHRDFVRSMITGTTAADAGMLVMDAQEGIMPQTREHAQLAKLMGLERIVVALNKIDKLGYDPVAIGKSASEVREMLEGHGFKKIDVIPLSAWDGENITARTERMSWYKGRTLLEVLDILEPRGGPKGGSFRMPILQVLQLGVGTVVLGRIERGEVKEGDELLVMPSGKLGVVRSIEAYGKKIDTAEAGETVGINLRNIGKMDVARGDVLGPEEDPPKLVEDFTAKIVLIGNVGIVRQGWSPFIHCHTCAVPVRLEAIEMKLRPDSGEEVGEAEAGYLSEGDAAIVRMRALKPLMLEDAEHLPGMSRFALRVGKDTLGAGTCISLRTAEHFSSGQSEASRGFSYKHQKAGSAAKQLKKRKEDARKDIWGKPLEKEK